MIGRARRDRRARLGARAARFWRSGGIRATLITVTPALQLVVCDGDETGQELLDEALRVLDPSVLGFECDADPFRPLPREPAADRERASCRRRPSAMRACGLGLKAATITPEGIGDVGSPEPDPA